MTGRWHCQRDGYTWPGCGACAGCRDCAPTIFAVARALADDVADHTLHHEQAIARLDAQRGELAGLRAQQQGALSASHAETEVHRVNAANWREQRNLYARRLAELSDELDTVTGAAEQALADRAAIYAELDELREHLDHAHAEIQRLTRGIDTAVFEIDFAMPTLWED